MKKLQFVANCDHQPEVNDFKLAQKQVADLLAMKLGQYGFETLSQSGDQIAVSVDNHALPLSVTCQEHDKSPLYR